MAALHHLDLSKTVLQSFGGRATLEQIQQVLVPTSLPTIGRSGGRVGQEELKKDGHFQVPLKKSEAIIYQVQEVSLQSRLLGEFRLAKGLKAKLAVVSEVLKNLADLQDQAAVAAEIIPAINRGHYQPSADTNLPGLEGVLCAMNYATRPVCLSPRAI